MPSILASLRSADLDQLEAELAALADSGITALHLDIMDGVFCDEVSFPLEQVRAIRALTDLPLDAHLMVAGPERAMDAWIEAGVQRISFHLEALKDPGPVLHRIRAAGVVPGLVILPDTPVAALDPWLGEVGLVNPLGVNPVAKTGYDAATPSRIQDLATRRTRGKHAFLIQADGGVWEKTRDDLVDAGADELVGGYPIFSNKDYKLAVEALQNGA